MNRVYDFKELEKKYAELKKRAEKAEAIIELQKKITELLNAPLKEQEEKK